MPLLCCDGCDTIEGRCCGGVKDLRPRFSHTDIRAGQRHLDDRHASLRCRHWERSREGALRRRVASTGPEPTACWSLVIDSARQVCATLPRSSPLPAALQPATLPRRLQGRRLADRRRTPISRASHTASRTGTITAGDIPRGRARLAAARGIRRRRGQQSRPPTRETSPTGRKCPRSRVTSPAASTTPARAQPDWDTVQVVGRGRPQATPDHMEDLSPR